MQSLTNVRSSRSVAFGSLLISISAFLAPMVCGAQSVRGTVRDSATLAPIAGVVIAAVGRTGDVLQQFIANSGGRYAIRLPAGSVRLRVTHIGFRPTSVLLDPNGPALRDFDIRLQRLPTMLQAFEVLENSKCTKRQDRAAALALYEQVRYGLTAAIVARKEAPAELKIIRYTRTFDARNQQQIRTQDVTVDSINSAEQSFLAVRSAARFVDSGFVNEADDGRTFYAPDAEVLVNEAFRNGYCFQISKSDDSRPGQVGLQFTPATRRNGRVDIEGKVWVDSAARELRDLEFQYVGVSRQETRLNSGGTVAFRTMPNGTVLIERWALRLVEARLETVPALSVGSADQIRTPDSVTRTVYSLHESGGELARARWADSSFWHGNLGTLNLLGRNAANAPQDSVRMQLVYSDYRATSDRTGRATMDDVLPGPYRLVVIDPELEKIALKLQTSVEFDAVRDSVHFATFTVPTRLDYAHSICPVEPTAGDIIRSSTETLSRTSVPRTPNAGVAFFVYVTTPDGTPLANVDITEALTTRTNPPSFRSDALGGKTDKGGRYYSCWNFQLGEDVQVWAKLNSQAPQVIVQQLSDKVHAIHFVIPPAGGSP